MSLNNNFREQFVNAVMKSLPEAPAYDGKKWAQMMRDRVENATLPPEVKLFADAYPNLIRRDDGYRVVLPGTESLESNLSEFGTGGLGLYDGTAMRIYFVVVRSENKLTDEEVTSLTGPLAAEAGAEYLARLNALVERRNLRQQLQAVAANSPSTQALEKAFPELVDFIPKDAKPQLPAIVGTSELVAGLVKAGLKLHEATE